MGCLTVIIFILNIGFSIYVDAMCFVFTQAMGANTGLGTVIAIIGMIIDNVECRGHICATRLLEVIIIWRPYEKDLSRLGSKSAPLGIMVFPWFSIMNIAPLYRILV